MVSIITRAQWGARPLVTPAGRIATPAPELWLHHTASRGLHGPAGMRALQQYAMRNGYRDLEYTYVGDTDGAAFESRGPGRDSAATGGGHNPKSHAICAMGNFEIDRPSDALLVTIAQLTRHLYETKASGTPTITGPHRAASGNSTACCGKYLIARIGDINRMATAAAPVPKPPEPGPPKEKDDMISVGVNNYSRAANEQPFGFLDPTARKVWSCWGFRVTWDGQQGDAPLNGTSDPKWLAVPGSAPLVAWEVVDYTHDKKPFDTQTGTRKRICVYGLNGAEYPGTVHG